MAEQDDTTLCDWCSATFRKSEHLFPYTCSHRCEGLHFCSMRCDNAWWAWLSHVRHRGGIRAALDALSASESKLK